MVGRYIGSKQDIMGSKPSKPKNHISGTGLQTIIDISSDLFLRIDPDGTINYANEATQKLLGRKSTDVIGLNITDISRDFDPKGKGYEEQSIIFLTPQDEERQLEVRWGDFNNNPDVKGTIVRARNASRRRELEQEQKYGRDLFAAAFQANNAMCSITDIESGKFLDVNEAWVNTLGHSREEAIGQSSLDLKIWDTPETRNMVIATMKAEGRLQNFEAEINTKSGETLIVSINGVTISVGGLQHTYFSSTNITEERKNAASLQESEARLRQAQKMDAVGQLTGGIAHDFNNLLSVILGNTELMDADSEHADQISAISRAAIRGAELTQNLLAFSRTQALKTDSFRLDEQLQPMLAILPRTLGEEISVETQTVPDLWDCHADQGQAENVLLKLAINARDAMPSGGVLKVVYANKTDTDGEFITMTISDTGTGMSDTVLERALEPFYTTKDVGEGTGLGLSMVYGFVEQSGGKLDIQSEFGAGTSVVISLPRAKA